MPVISCYVSDDAYRLLQIASQELARKVEDIAEAAIENAALEYKVRLPGYAQYTDHRP